LFIIFVQEFRNMADQTLYEELGEENLQKLVDGFYDLVFINPRISRLFKTDKDLIKEKQRLFLTQFLGGPSLYSEKYGHPRMRARHMPHPIEEEDAVEWLKCMSASLAKLDVSERLKDDLFKRFVPTAMFMVNKGEEQ
jgi:hemoglobin